MTIRSLSLASLLLGTLWSAALGQSANEEGQIDLSPLLGGREGSAPLQDATPAPQAEPADDGDAALPRYMRTQTVDATAPTTPRPMFYPAESAAGSNIQRLSGEYSELALSVTVPPGATIESFVITYRNSINILEDDSRISVLLNGKEIASWSPAAPGDFETRELPVDALQTGQNTIVVRAEQSHRIFCGPEASFGIWTDIAPARSGIAVTLGSIVPDIDVFSRAAQAQLASGQPLPVVTTLDLDAARIRDLEQRIVSLGHNQAARLALESPYQTSGTPNGMARIAIIPNALVPSGMTLPRFETTPNGSVIMVMSDTTSPSVLDQLLPMPGAINGPPKVLPGTGASLSDLGAGELALRSHYERRDIPFRLPDDWLVLSAQKAQINLLYRYVDGLPEGSLLLLKVNETTVRLLPLFGQGDTPLPPLSVGFPARLLQPGMNAISFEAIIPGDPPELPCPRIEGPFLRISGETTVTVPGSPRMQYPALSAAIQSLTPDNIKLMPDLGGDTRSEAVLTALSVGLPAVSDRPVAKAPPTLTISTLVTLDKVPLNTLGIDRLALERVLTPSRAVPVPVIAGISDFGLPAPTGPSYADGAKSLLSDAWSWGRNLGWPGDPALTDWIASREGIALLFMPDPAAPQDMWLVIGPNADPRTLTIALSEGRMSPFGPNGQAALLSDGGTWQNWRPASTYPQLLDPLTFSNARAVAGNYASWSPVFFVGLLAILMSLSVFLGISYVVTTRGARKR